MELIDSHAHIDFPQFADDREAMLERARAAGVSIILAIGTGPDRRNWMRPYPTRKRTSGSTPLSVFTRTRPRK